MRVTNLNQAEMESMYRRKGIEELSESRASDYFPERLRTARSLRGFSAQGLARKAGLHSSQVSTFETGARMPNIETLRRLVHALDITADYLIGTIDIPDSATANDGVLRRDVDNLKDSDCEFASRLMRTLNGRGAPKRKKNKAKQRCKPR